MTTHHIATLVPSFLQMQNWLLINTRVAQCKILHELRLLLLLCTVILSGEFIDFS